MGYCSHTFLALRSTPRSFRGTCKAKVEVGEYLKYIVSILNGTHDSECD
jgi:hypothetical protein